MKKKNKEYTPDYEEIMQDGLKQIEIGKRMVEFAKHCLDEDTEDMEEDDEDEDMEADDDEPKSKSGSKRGIILAIQKGAFK